MLKLRKLISIFLVQSGTFITHSHTSFTLYVDGQFDVEKSPPLDVKRKPQGGSSGVGMEGHCGVGGSSVVGGMVVGVVEWQV